MELLYKNHNYPPANRFYQILKENDIKATHTEVKEFISKQAVNQVHKKVEYRRSKSKHFTASYPNEIFQIDLLDYQKYSHQNKGYKWILICIDIFTRKAYARPVKNKTASLVEEAFKDIGVIPKVAYHDEGNEFKGKFLEYLNENNVINVENDTGNHNSLGIVDRFSRTIKMSLSRYMTANDTTKWYIVLPRLIELYNNTPHKGTGNIKPNDIEDNEINETQVSTLNFNKQMESVKQNKKQEKFKVGDRVRVQIKKGTFTKGYEITYTKEVYMVESIEHSNATLNNGESYQFSQLQKVPDGTTVIIKKGIKEKADKASKIVRLLRKEGLE